MAKRRMTLDLSERLDEILTELADETGTTKSEVLRKAIGLFEAVHKARQKGDKILVTDDQYHPKVEMVGL